MDKSKVVFPMGCASSYSCGYISYDKLVAMKHSFVKIFKKEDITSFWHNHLLKLIPLKDIILLQWVFGYFRWSNFNLSNHLGIWGVRKLFVS